MSLKEKFISKKRFLMIAVFAGSIIFLNLTHDSEKEINEIKKEIESTKKFDYENLYINYKRLSKLLPADEEIKKSVEKYERLDSFATQCKINAVAQDKKSLSNMTSYDSDLLDKNLIEKWTDEKTFVYQNTFSGKNSFNQKKEFVSSYRCTITPEGLRIKKIQFKEI